METHSASSTSNSRNPWFVPAVVIVILVLIAVAVAALASFGPFAKKTTWSAVFLTDNEIFFGHMKTADSNQIEMTNVYYLQQTQPPQGTQANGQTATPQLSINSLVTSQIQCPQDDILIDRPNVLYVQDLQDGSFVVARLNTLQQQSKNCFQPTAASPTPVGAATPTAAPSATPSPSPAASRAAN